MELSLSSIPICQWLTGAWVTLEQARAGGVKRRDRGKQVPTRLFTTTGPGDLVSKNN